MTPFLPSLLVMHVSDALIVIHEQPAHNGHQRYVARWRTAARAAFGAVITTTPEQAQPGRSIMPDGINRHSSRAGASTDVATLPNVLTFGRICAVPIAIWLVLRRDCAIAAILFALAGLTDALDGWLARRQGPSILGTLLDPLADKLLLTSMFITLAAIGLLPLWLTILVVFRDGMIIGGIGLLRLLGRTVAIRPLIISKLNSVAQITLVGVTLAEAGFAVHPPYIRPMLIGLVALTTLISGGAYVMRGSRLV
ncbi:MULTISPECIES: CDP-alcohol phosphatidyltransferase family protein [Acidiphilium]|nr:MULTISPECIES: CDP-alcohol phosphatidyltransferase family protein [Acidiphilium]